MGATGPLAHPPPPPALAHCLQLDARLVVFYESPDWQPQPPMSTRGRQPLAGPPALHMVHLYQVLSPMLVKGFWAREDPSGRAAAQRGAANPGVYDYERLRHWLCADWLCAGCHLNKNCPRRVSIPRP